MRVKLEGFKELDRALGELPKATAKNVLRRTLTTAGEPIRAQAESLAPDDPETPSPDLHTRIIISSKQKTGRAKKRTFAKGGDVEVFVGPERRHSAKGQFMEFGTFKDAAQPFLTPAWEGNKFKALDIIKAKLGSEVEKAANRLAKKGR